MTKHEDLYRRRLTSPELALCDLPKRCSVLLGIFAAQPPALVRAFADRAKAGDLNEALVYYMHATPATIEALMRLDLMDVIKLYPFFLGAGERGLARQLNERSRKIVHFVPNSFSEIPGIVRERPPFDVFLLQVAPMDRAGWFSFGPSGAYSLAGIERSKRIIVEVNRNMPRSHGTGQVHVSQVSAIVENTSEISAYASKATTDTDRQIAAHVMPMIQDGACVQFGVGGVPNIIAGALTDRKNLGVHTELLSDGLASLIASGAVTNRHKTTDRGKSVFNVAMGTAATYDLIDDNPSIECRMADYVNDPRVIGENDNVVSVNAMIEVDLTGQVNAEFLATHEYGGAGGQLDFVKGASYSRGGLSFIVGSSTAAHGKASRIVPKLQGPATDARIDTQYIVTEHGICNLRGMSSDERAYALIGLAQPSFRDELTAAAREMHLI
ncbi:MULTISPECIES: acetyl-CoA hydrolase/transferase family protein [unclassified Bradyrhizobium]|uniref:acetyl-CoA hydrolase/transferase family protein n=1 Tax=unclassified Bradyrhizobium TaxID=2631580 RepID=UPI0004164E2C|nr:MULTISPECIES: acetyl-CoA hydrolase/transferase C-terminal domain-containing protein [unclassified Bradyrhizobium]MCP3464638.1 acetyl-CoA hydrolase/transferase family protein [Bradyrhizobium sp. CCGUVB23]